jgi:hypothetical protein
LIGFLINMLIGFLINMLYRMNRARQLNGADQAGGRRAEDQQQHRGQQDVSYRLAEHDISEVEEELVMNQILIYKSEDGRTKLDVRLENRTVWLSQKQLTDLFDKAKGTISEHIKHIFEDKELVEESVVRLFRTTAADGKQYEVSHYNLDMVLALGFRVRSPVAVSFRQWAADKP